VRALLRQLGLPDEPRLGHSRPDPGRVTARGAERGRQYLLCAPRAIHNTENVIPLEEGLHTRVSGFYSSIQ
jgi:hypothetical protein